MRVMAGASIVLALFSVALMALVALRPDAEVSEPTRVDDVVGLMAVADPDEEGKGWYRTYLNTVVRDSVSLESEELDVLPVGSRVYVERVQGRRARILHPLTGWVSLSTKDGITILRRDTSFQTGVNETELAEAFRTPEFLEAAEELQVASQKLDNLKQHLVEMLNTVDPEHLQKRLATARSGSNPAPELSDLLAKRANTIGKSVKEEQAAKFLREHTKGFAPTGGAGDLRTILGGHHHQAAAAEIV